jgi:hypothetical protein
MGWVSSSLERGQLLQLCLDFSFTASPWAAELLENATDELLSNKWREYLMRPMLKGAGKSAATAMRCY